MPNYLPEDFIEEVRVANEITDVYPNTDTKT